MAATFDVAKAICVSGSEMVQLLSQLSAADFTLSVLHTLVVVANNSSSSSKAPKSRVGIVTGFADLSKLQGGGGAVQIIDGSNKLATANVGLVVNFGGSKETVQLNQLLSSATATTSASDSTSSFVLTQADHGLFVQQCKQHNAYLPEPEHVSEIRERLNRGRRLAKSQQQQAGSSFATWKVVGASGSDSAADDTRRRQREDVSSSGGGGASEQESLKLLSRLEDRRVQQLQSQITSQLTELAQARNENRALREQIEQANARGGAQSQQQQQQQQQQVGGGSSGGAAAAAKLMEAVGSLTGRVQSLNATLDEVVTLAAAKLKVQPTKEAVLAALRQ